MEDEPNGNAVPIQIANKRTKGNLISVESMVRGVRDQFEKDGGGTKIGRLRSAFDELEKLRLGGMTVARIHKGLTHSGFEISLFLLTKYLHTIRRERELHVGLATQQSPPAKKGRPRTKNDVPAGLSVQPVQETHSTQEAQPATAGDLVTADENTIYSRCRELYVAERHSEMPSSREETIREYISKHLETMNTLDQHKLTRLIVSLVHD